jgi:hypothetical protein
MKNTCKDEWPIAIKDLQDGKNRTQKATKKNFK